jgi:hypothetical protein
MSERRPSPPVDTTATSATAGLGGLRLDELLTEVQDRLAEIVKTRDRLQGLLDAVMAVGAGLELDSTLRRIVQAAVDLVDARYGALGVLGPHEGLLPGPGRAIALSRRHQWCADGPPGQGHCPV